MVSLLRKYQKSLMIIITILIIIAFGFFYNGSRGGIDRAPGTQYIGKIYDRSISQTEADREVRKFEVARVLQMVDLQNALVGQAFTQEQALTNFILNSFVLRHEAARLQISPTDEEVKTGIMNTSLFQTNGAFDSEKYDKFVANFLTPNGFTATQLEELVRDDLRLKKIKELLGSTFIISPETFRTAYTQGFQKLDVSVIRFNQADFAKDVKISDDDIKKAFDAHPDNYKSEEKRKIKLVAFALSDTEKKLTGVERTSALQKVSDQANDFWQAMSGKNAKFDDLVAKFKAPVTEIPPFTQNTPDPKISSMPAVVDAAFHVTKDQPDSDPVQGENGYYVVHLEDIVPSKALTLEEARAQITEELKDSRAHEMLTLKASEARNKIDVDLKAGKSIADAAKAAGVKVETYTGLSLAEPNPEVPGSREIAGRASELADGAISEFIPSPDGGTLIRLDKREPIDEAKFEKDKAMLAPRLVDQRLNLVFADWLRKQRDEAKIQLPRTASSGQPQPPAP